VLEDAGLLLGEDDHLPGPFGEALKHCSCLSVGITGLAIPASSLKIGIYADRIKGRSWVYRPVGRVYQRPPLPLAP
jgi:hypothetical protein